MALNNQVTRKRAAHTSDQTAPKAVHKHINGQSFGKEDWIEPSSIVSLLGWRWRDVMHELPFLAKHGFDAIKLSPVAEGVEYPNHPWWSIYQPVSYQFNKYYGSKEDLVRLIDTAHSYDLKIYLDLVINHMAEYPEHATSPMRGVNGTSFTKYNYGPLTGAKEYWTFDDFYHFKPKSNHQITDEDYSTFDGVWRLEHYDFLNMPKLDVTKPHVKQVLRELLQFYLSLGVDGFRLDAAKHLYLPAIHDIFKDLKTHTGHAPFIYQEYYLGSDMGVDLYSYMVKYFRLGYVTSFKYGEFLAQVFTQQQNTLEKLVAFNFGRDWVHFPANRTVTVIDNHDTERMMPNMLNFNTTQFNAYVLAYIFMLAWPFGIPHIMSSFYFKAHDDSFPEATVWNGDQDCGFNNGAWVLQHRWQAISNMVLFHRLTLDAPGVAHVWAHQNQVAFSRVKEVAAESIVAQGFVVINASSEPLTRKFDTGLPDGNYFNLIESRVDADRMQGPMVQVKDFGKTELTIKPFDAVVLLLNYRG